MKDTISLQELAHQAGVKLQGDPDRRITGLASLEKAGAQELAFLTNRRYRKFLNDTKAGAVLLSPEDAAFCSVPALISENPRLSLAKISQLFERKSQVKPGIHPTAVIGKDCEIPNTVDIGAYVVLGDRVVLGDQVVVGPQTVIGDDCHLGHHTVLKARVTLYDNVRLGNHCLIHSGAVLGSDGFGYAEDAGNWIKMPHLGGVTLGDKVEIGANTTIDRGFMEDTRIGNGAIIDNLVQVGHNVSIGERTAIAGCVAIAGSTSIGNGCLIGGGACLAGHLDIADGVCITATAGVNSSISMPGIYSAGLPAKPNHIWRKNAARFQYLDDMAKRLKVLEVMHQIKPAKSKNASETESEKNGN